jgi:hypothetical protein
VSPVLLLALLQLRESSEEISMCAGLVLGAEDVVQRLKTID